MYLTWFVFFQFYRVPISNNVLDCQSVPDQGYKIWHIILLSYKGFIQVLSIPLAFGARKVPIKGLNDSIYIISIIYITSVSLAVIIVCFATLNNQGLVNVLAAVYSIGFWISASVILLLVFVPKVSLSWHRLSNICRCTVSPVAHMCTVSPVAHMCTVSPYQHYLL